MSTKKTLLIIEDDPGLQKQMKWSFDNFDSIIAGDKEQAIKALQRHKPNVVTLDLGLPPDPTNASVGLELLEEILQLAPETKVIVVTGNDDRNNAIAAIAKGAYDFYQKPIDIDVLNLIIERAFHLTALENENAALHHHPVEPLAGIIASSKVMQDLSRMVEKIASTSATALLLGESGTGKEVIAKAIHALSERSEQAFIAVNCAAIPDNLLESELFGHEKGAFTGAVKQTKGKIEFADKGTLLLDEIGDLPFALQAKLLRFIQERTIERIGGRKEIPIDTRIICATHQNIDQLIKEGLFRSDLYYRISEITIKIPPLRERENDAYVIAKSLLQRYSKLNNKQISGFSPEAALAIESYHWPGNIRELENIIKRAVIMADGSRITSDDLELAEDKNKTPTFNLKEVRMAAESTAIIRALQHTDHNISECAKLLGITRPTLYSLLNKYNIAIQSHESP